MPVIICFHRIVCRTVGGGDPTGKLSLLDLPEKTTVKLDTKYIAILASMPSGLQRTWWIIVHNPCRNYYLVLHTNGQ